MAILCGIKAVISVDGDPAEEVPDRGQNKELKPVTPCGAANKVSTFISHSCNRPGFYLKIGCSLQPDFDLDCGHITLLVSYRGVNRSLTYHEVSSLKCKKNIVIFETSLGEHSGDEFTTIDLNICRMKKPLRGLGVASDIQPIEGNIRSEESKNLGKSGKHLLSHQGKEYEIELQDVLNPTATFTWKYATRSTLQNLLIIPRTPDPSFKVLTIVSHFPTLEPHIVNSEWSHLIRGKTLLQLDQLAFEYLGRFDITKCGIEEVEEKASKYVNNQDIPSLNIDEVYTLVEQNVNQEVRNQIHTRTLRILAEDKFKDSVSGGHEMNAEIMADELAKLSDEELHNMADEQHVCEELVRKMPIKLVKKRALEQLRRLYYTPKLSIFDAKKYASKREMEQRFHIAQLQAVATVAGERLLEIQQPEIHQQTAAKTPAAQEAQSPASQVHVKQEEASAATILGDGSTSGNSRKRARI